MIGEQYQIGIFQYKEVLQVRNYSSIIAFVGILILIIIPIYQDATTSTDNEDYLDIVNKSFQATQGEFYELNIEAWAQINKRGIEAEELKTLYLSLAKELSLGSTDMELEEYEDFLGIYGQGQVDGETYVQLILQSFYSEGIEAGTYLGIQISLNNLKEGRLWYDLVGDIFANLEIPTEVGVTLVGIISGELSKGESEKEAILALEACQAEIVEGISTPELLSLSGYTQDCKDYLEVKGKKININVALRYHLIDNQTYIHLGAPLIFQEY